MTSIYYHHRTKVNYRKIYEQHYGLIPKEADGRTYEIHHIDGDHSNNDPTNLKAVTIQEHYDLHYAQQDWGACHTIALRMSIPPITLSELQRRRVEDGTHNFLTMDHSKNVQKRIKEGTHNLLGSAHALARLAKGTHPSQIKKTCPHCDKTMGSGQYVQWHGDKCKLNM